MTVCVIGAGAAGITIATLLARQGVRVCLVEAGALAPQTDDDERNDIIRSGVVPQYLSNGVRGFGGTTAVWGGHCTPMMPRDFAVHEWIDGSGWPLSPDALTRFYQVAQDVCDAGPAVYSSALDDACDLPPTCALPQWDPALLMPWYWQLSPPTRFASKFGPELFGAPTVTVLLNTTATRLRYDSSDHHVARVEVRGPDGAPGEVEADTFVLCCGGIENARLLLASLPERTLAEASAIGKHFTDHLYVIVGTVTPREDSALEQLYGERRLSRVMDADGHRVDVPFFGGLALADDVIRREQLINACATFHRIDDELRLVARCEQIPLGASTVALSSRCDANGEPLGCVDWQIDPIEQATIRRLAQTVAAECARLGIGTVRLEPWLDSEDWHERILLGHHPAGTTRMSSTPSAGVVDGNCRVHGVDNLYAAGSSVFPTNGFANPTLTIVALAARLAQHLHPEGSTR
jgi:choline dehydrogenase-like flavoprotein